MGRPRPDHVHRRHVGDEALRRHQPPVLVVYHRHSGVEMTSRLTLGVTLRPLAFTAYRGRRQRPPRFLWVYRRSDAVLRPAAAVADAAKGLLRGHAGRQHANLRCELWEKWRGPKIPTLYLPSTAM